MICQIEQKAVKRTMYYIIDHTLYFGSLHKMTSLDLWTSRTLFARSEHHKVLHPGREQYAPVAVNFFCANSFSKFENFARKLSSLVKKMSEKALLSQ